MSFKTSGRGAFASRSLVPICQNPRLRLFYFPRFVRGTPGITESVKQSNFPRVYTPNL